MVEKETINEPTEITLPVQKIERNGDGSWSLVLDVNVQIPIDTTRTAYFFGDLRIKGRQLGRKIRTDASRYIRHKGK